MDFISHLKRATLALLLSAISGCAYVETASSDGTTTRSLVFSPAPLSDQTEADVVVRDIYLLGLWTGPQESGLGFHHSRQALVYGDCASIFWVDDGRKLASLASEVKRLEYHC